MIQRFIRVYGNARFPILRENPDNLDLEISAVALSRFATVPLVPRLHAHISSIVRASDSINERFPVTAGYPSGLSELSVRVTVGGWRCAASRIGISTIAFLWTTRSSLGSQLRAPAFGYRRWRYVSDLLAPPRSLMPNRGHDNGVSWDARGRFYSTCDGAFANDVHWRDRLGPRSLYTRGGCPRIVDLNGSHRFGPFSVGRSTSSSHRDNDPLPDRSSPPTATPPPPPHLLSEYNSSALLADVLLLADSTTTRVGHFVLGGGVRRGHDPRRPENRSLTFFRWRSPSSESE